jgi:hypothetical protein
MKRPQLLERLSCRLEPVRSGGSALAPQDADFIQFGLVLRIMRVFIFARSAAAFQAQRRTPR